MQNESIDMDEMLRGLSQEEIEQLMAGADAVLEEDSAREERNNATFNPITGEGSTLSKDRIKITITDFPFAEQWIPIQMADVQLVRLIVKCGSIEAFFNKHIKPYYAKKGRDVEWSSEEKQKIIEQFVRIRIKYDFAFWAALYCYIKPKGGGENVLFRLNGPQRKLIEYFESLRLAGLPIRLILLKARQWGGSTCTQLYMAWLQLVHSVGLNSLIIAHQGTGSDEIEDMFRTMINLYPTYLLYELGAAYRLNEPKFVGVGKSGNIHRVPQRSCKIKIGTAERPDSARGGDYNLVHCSEVGIWKKTEGKTPQQIIKAATSGILYKPLTMIIYESTANGTGNFFAIEYEDAKQGRSQFKPLFIAWYEIEQYSMPFDSPEQKRAFAIRLYLNRNNDNTASNREEPGKYLWWLWCRGATLEAINWYITERAKYVEHGDMASEYPSDDVEAFVHSGNMVFDKYQVEELKKSCMAPKFIGDVYGDSISGAKSLENVRFKVDHQGSLWIWEKPEEDEKDEKVLNRYIVIVDIGGRSKKSDFSSICVIDRMFTIDGGKPVVVAQWYGHMDMDLLSWKAAQIAKYYNNAMLVIESNTLETHDKERQVDGDQSGYILNQIKEHYDNLYARKQSDEEIRAHAPLKYGFHTNTATKPKIVSTLQKYIRDNGYIERDERCIHEYLVYEKRQNGSWGAIIGMHDDLLMTRGIGLVVSDEMEEVRIVRIESHQSSGRASKSAASIV